MAIEANVDVIISRAIVLADSASELSSTLRRFIRVRSELQSLGQPMTNQQRLAAVTAANQAAADVQAAATALSTAYTAIAPI